MDWLKIGSAVFLIMMIVFIWPQARRMMDESRKAEAGDWQGVILPVLAVAGFVALLMWLV